MVTGKSIHEPVVFCAAEFLTDVVITARDRVCNQAGDLVEGNEVDAKNATRNLRLDQYLLDEAWRR